MPFRSRGSSRPKTRVVKAGEQSGGIVDPTLQREVDAIAAPFRRAMDGLVATVRRTQEQLRTGSLQELQTSLSDEIVRELQRAANTVANVMSRQAFRDALRAAESFPPDIKVGYRFDGKDPRAIEWARREAGKMIIQIENETLQQIRLIIGESLDQGIPMEPTARRIERIIGLHDRWATAVNNMYERELARQIASGITSDVATQRAQNIAAAYRKRLVKARARNIARTEIAAAQNYGTYLSWLQAGDQGYANLATAKKEWVAGPSGWRGVTVCDICAPLNGQQVGVNAMFPNGLMMPPAHPSCRCTMIFVPMNPPGQ